MVPTLSVKAVNTVGAGDCFSDALVSAYIKNHDLLKTARLATVAAGINGSPLGGHDAIRLLEEVEQRLS